MPEDTLPLHIRVRIEARDARLKRLGYASYSDYLKSDAWAERRCRYRASPALPQECFCGETNVEFHHTTYERVGQERLDDLVPLCTNCHQMLHALEARGVVGLDYSVPYDMAQALAYRATRADRNAKTPEQYHDARLQRAIETKRARSRARRKRKNAGRGIS